ncbi:MAG: phosphoglucosamine mutase [Pyrinomonadaceae bacterium]
MQKLFGTDGIRGTAGEFPLDDRTLIVIGAALARHFGAKAGRGPRFITGRDTRESGLEIEEAIHSGAASQGGRCESAGVITTPGVAFLTARDGFDAGLVISASHNPFEDNGIKVFLPDGRKLDETDERAIEADIFRELDGGFAAERVEIAANDAGFREEYIDHLLEKVPGLRLCGMRIVVDCANGAASGIAEELLARLDASAVAINNRPDGRNINKDCGSMHLEHLQDAVRKQGADLGVAFDGDADRALFVDETGEIVDGDAVLWILGRRLHRQGRLAGDKVVATVMSNIGLEIAFRSIDVELVRTAVGDKYVLDELLRTGASIGGEQSGHIIVPANGLVGDGLMTMLMLLEALAEADLALSRMRDGFKRFPQVLVNVPVREKRPFESVPEIAAAAESVEREIDGTGRLLLRYSGTENLARVMIEGPEQALIEAQANRLAEVIRSTIG